MSEQTPEVPAEPTAVPAQVAPELVAEPIEDGKGALVGAPPGSLLEEEGGHAALVGHPDVPDEVQPLTGQPEDAPAAIESEPAATAPETPAPEAPAG